MSDVGDQESREHEASDEKLKQARERGDTPSAPDMWLLGSFMAISLALNLLPGFATRASGRALGGFFEICADISLTSASDVIDLSRSTIAALVLDWMFVVGGMCVIAITIGSFAHAPGVSWSRVAIDVGRLDPIKGVSRIFGLKGLVAFGRAISKMAIASIVLIVALREQWIRLAKAPSPEAPLVGVETTYAIERIAVTMTVVAVVFGVLDVVLSRRRWRKKLRMTTQEMKDEIKKAEGDPHVKMRMRSIALDRARKRMLSDVESATMVIANPTHYALALRYLREEGGAPVVVAKGQELIALKIRAEAVDRKIPVVEQPELARAMYRRVEVGDAIPVEFYRAVAEIVNFLSKRNPPAYERV
ncbi:MAG: EscU/YscU/HrcU family type III secretion system export apparatus switch protein [Rhodoblastus sp.]